MIIEKLALLIPIYNQSKHWKLILKGIEANPNIPKKVYVLLDRASDEDYNHIKNLSDLSELNIQVIRVPTPPHYLVKREPVGEPFYTGYVRNYGIDLAIEEGYTQFIFIDGCINNSSILLYIIIC